MLGHVGLGPKDRCRDLHTELTGYSFLCISSLTTSLHNNFNVYLLTAIYCLLNNLVNLFFFSAMTPPRSIKHLTKRRATTPVRRPPTKKKLHASSFPQQDSDEDEEDDEGEDEVEGKEKKEEDNNEGGAAGGGSGTTVQLPELKQIGEEILV